MRKGKGRTASWTPCKPSAPWKSSALRISSCRGCSAPTATMGLDVFRASKPSGFPDDLRHAFSFSSTWNSATTLRRHLAVWRSISAPSPYPTQSILSHQDRQEGADLCNETLPYVTEIMATSSSSGRAVRASSIARTSSTPAQRVSQSATHVGPGHETLAWVGVDNDAVLWSHGCLGSEIDLRPSQQEVRIFHVDLALCLCLCLCLCIHLRLPAIPMRWNRSNGT